MNVSSVVPTACAETGARRNFRVVISLEGEFQLPVAKRLSAGTVPPDGNNGDTIMRVAMWSGPRNLSTAMMYAFAQRADFVFPTHGFSAASCLKA